MLVTGGAGYIGSHVCKALAESGAIPICYDTLEKGNEWGVRWGPLEHGDVGDAGRLDAVFRKYRPARIIHLAGYIEVGESLQQPARYLDNNFTKSRVLIQAALNHEVEALVFSSTCAVYGLPQAPFLEECHRVAPINPYAESKARVEALLARAAEIGLRSVALRYFNAAGADPAGAIGEAHQPETHLQPLAADAALGIGPPLTVLGTDYETPDGSCVRDYVHVCDLADAHLKALHWLPTNSAAGHFESFNLGSGIGYSVLQVIEEVSRLAGRGVPFAVGPRRPGDSPRLVGDISKVARQLGWQPSRCLSAQIEDTLRWRRNWRRMR